MSTEPESLVLQLLRDMRSEMTGIRQEMAGIRDELKSDIQALRRDAASDLIVLQAKQAEEHKHTREQITGLRRAVMEYHASVIGHGILISELEARVRRAQQHLDLPSIDAH